MLLCYLQVLKSNLAIEKAHYLQDSNMWIGPRQVGFRCILTFVLFYRELIINFVFSVILIDLPSLPLDNIRVMVIVWRLRGNIMIIALCWIV